MRRLFRILLILVLFPPLLAALGGWLSGPTFLHPLRREFTAADVKQADAAFAQTGARREDFDVRAPDGITLHGWKVRSAHPNGSWVLAFHGVADNRMGVLDHSLLLLRGGYNVVLMDSRAHGANEESIATYGWLERKDAHAIVTSLIETERAVAPVHIFALGESMGAGIALQSAGADSRIEAVVAEASFASLREASYDYAGLQKYPLLGKTLFAPGAWMMIYRGQSMAGFPAGEVSPVKAVASRAFPVLLICDGDDTTLPCRHTEKIYAAAIGPKQMWVVPKAFHTGALGYQPEEFNRRVLAFLRSCSSVSQ